MNLWHFEITCRNGQVSVLEYTNTEVQPLKNNGEEVWEIRPDFWLWFKDKICYAGEPISFVVIGQSPILPPPPEDFQLARHNHCHQALTEDAIFQAYPELSAEPPKQPDRPANIPQQPIKPDSLQGFFVRQTQKYQKDT